MSSWARRSSRRLPPTAMPAFFAFPRFLAPTESAFSANPRHFASIAACSQSWSRTARRGGPFETSKCRFGSLRRPTRRTRPCNRRNARDGDCASPRPSTKSDALQVCPMHPKFEAAHPGFCPYCGMELVSRSSSPGPRAIQVAVKSNRGEGSVSFEADIEAPESQWILLGPSLAVPPLGILLFVLHQSLRHRMHPRRGERARK